MTQPKYKIIKAMKRTVTTAILLVLGTIALLAQDFMHQPFIIINDTAKIYPDEFMYMYHKNTLPNDTIAPEQYLDLFVNYKLKVLDALEHGYQKDSAFRAEYEKYLLQAAENKFKDQRLEQQLLDKYYNWLQTEVRTSYILKKIPNNATPEDTARLYNELLELRKRALNGEDFSSLAMQYSDAPRVKKDHGDAGYLSIFDIPGVFHDFVWNAKIGDVSMPTRFLNMYYIIKVTGRRPAKGKYHVAQIFISLPLNHSKKDSLKAMKKLRTIDSSLKAGVPFENLAKKYSDDFQSARNGGDMGWIRPGQTIPAFEKAIFTMNKPGEITGPIRTILGYHYIKLLEKQDYSDFSKQKKAIIRLLAHTPAYRLVKTHKLDSLKHVYGFRMLGSMDSVYNHIDNSIFQGKWQDSSLINNHKSLFELGGKKYSYSDFAHYIMRIQYPTIAENPRTYIKRLFDDFVYDKVKHLYVKDLVQQKGTDFYYLAKEFYEGLLLFNISNDRVWKRASEDTLGLRMYYEQHPDKYANIQYITILKAKNNKSLKKAIKALRKYKPQIVDTSFVKHYIKDTNIVFVEQKLIKQGQDTAYALLFEKLKKKPGQKIFTATDNRIIFVNDKFNQIRGFVTADYQNYLEQKWIEDLRNKHKIVFNNKEQVLKLLENEK